MTEALRSVIERLVADSPTFFAADRVTITPDRHQARPFSDVWRARVDGAAGTQAIYIKVGKQNPGGPSPETMRARLHADFETTARVHAAMRAETHVAAVRPIAYFGDLLALVTEEVVGVNLLERLERGARRWGAAEAPDASFEYAGLWLRRFQDIEGVGGPRPFGEIVEYVDVRLRRLAANPRSSFDDRDRGRVLAYLDARRRDVDADDLADVAIHGDFAPANAIAGHGRVVVLDFAMNRRGTRFHDIARFHMQMELLKLKPQIDARVVCALQAALLRGYRADLTASRPMFEVLSLLHTVNHFETLVTKAAAFPSGLYNRYVARRHRRWIFDTTASSRLSAAHA